MPSRKFRLFPIGGRDAASVLWRLPGNETTGPVVPDDHKGQFNCSFLWEERKTKGGRGRSVQQPSIRAKACRLLNPNRAPNFAVNPYKFRAKLGLEKQCTSRGNPLREGYGQPGTPSELDRGPLPLVAGGSRPGGPGFLIKPARRGPVERRGDEASTWRGETAPESDPAAIPRLVPLHYIDHNKNQHTIGGLAELTRSFPCGCSFPGRKLQNPNP